MDHYLSLIVATKDRPTDLRNLLQSLSLQSVRPREIVIVDASAVSPGSLLADFPALRTLYVRHNEASASAQRNAGLKVISPDATLVAFADDDTTFEPQAFQVMLEFWNGAAQGVLGTAFNIQNGPERGVATFKNSAFVKWLGLYSPEMGAVSRSGWQTVVSSVHESKTVQWLPSTAVVFRRTALNGCQFDEFYERYSYLEDLDISYLMGRAGKLMIIADAHYSHFPSTQGRISATDFGRYETRNRLYFVRKHDLSMSRCYVGIIVRGVMTIAEAIRSRNPSMLRRAYGNALGLASHIFQRSRVKRVPA